MHRGDLVFDVGANVGSYTSSFLLLGARVVAVEPQPGCAQVLRRRFRRHDVEVEECALGAAAGTAVLQIPETSTIASMSEEWVAAVRASGRFSDYNWTEQLTIEVTTLDDLIEAYGDPAFMKIDVEGFEADVLAGLSRPVPALSLEYVPEFSTAALSCVEKLVSLGLSEFNLALGRALGFAWESWLPAEEASARLVAGTEFGDLYARLGPLSSPQDP